MTFLDCKMLFTEIALLKCICCKMINFLITLRKYIYCNMYFIKLHSVNQFQRVILKRNR